MNLKDFRIVYAGTPDFAVPALAALIEAGYDVVAVYTQPDRRAGRGRKLRPSPVKTLALEHSIAVEQPLSLRDSEQQALLQSYSPDLMVVAAYGQILPVEILQTPTYGCFNIHGSLLPRWRGAAPVQRAIEHGDATSGVTIMQMDKGLDTGDMLYKTTCEISAATTGVELHDQLSALGSKALLATLAQLHEGTLSPESQDDSASCYAAKIEKSEAIIDWSLPALEIHRKVCAFNAWPVAQTMLDGEVIRIWESSVVDQSPDADDILSVAGGAGRVVAAGDHLDVATGDGVLRIHKLQPPGKKAMAVSDFLNSRSIAEGTQLG